MIFHVPPSVTAHEHLPLCTACACRGTDMSVTRLHNCVQRSSQCTRVTLRIAANAPACPARLPVRTTGARRALCEMWAIFDPFPPTAKLAAVTTVFPYKGLPRFLLSPKTQLKLCFTLKMPDCCGSLLFLPCARLFPQWWVVCRVVTGNRTYEWALCARRAETPPTPVPMFPRPQSSEPGGTRAGVVRALAPQTRINPSAPLQLRLVCPTARPS